MFVAFPFGKPVSTFREMLWRRRLLSSVLTHFRFWYREHLAAVRTDDWRLAAQSINRPKDMVSTIGTDQLQFRPLCWIRHLMPPPSALPRPSAWMRSTTAGSLSTATKAALSFAITPGGVPAGATMMSRVTSVPSIKRITTMRLALQAPARRESSGGSAGARRRRSPDSSAFRRRCEQGDAAPERGRRSPWLRRSGG
jgi:hypothetical protein